MLSKKALKEKLEHIKIKKDYFWGRDKKLYHFYDAQEVLLRDLMVNHKKIRRE